MRKSRTLLLVVSVLTLVLSVCQGGTAGPKIVLKAAHVLSNTSHYQVGMEKFSQLVGAKTNGQVEVQVFPNAILGSERDMIEGMQLGTLDIGLVSTAPIGQFSPKMMLFDLPFLFKDSAHAWKVADSWIGDELFAELKPIGIIGLAYWENGFRHVFTRTKEIKQPSDLQGLKIRTMENPIHVASFQALGAVPTPMAWGELFTALQQGTVDGAENSLVTIYTSRFQEVAKYVALTGHFYGIAPLLMSKKTYDKLPKEFREAIMEAAREARDFQRKTTVDMESDIISKLEKEGMKVIRVDRKAFREKCRGVYEKFKNQVPPELVTAVLEME